MWHVGDISRLLEMISNLLISLPTCPQVTAVEDAKSSVSGYQAQTRWVVGCKAVVSR